MMKVSVSFLKQKNNIEDTIKKIELTSADYIHVDVMDGKFVDNTFLPLGSSSEYLSSVKKPLDVHLMVEDPINYIEEYSRLNSKIITIHKEIDKNIEELLNYIKSKGIKAGLAINPETSVESIKDYLKILDYIIVMGVHPGYGGQELIPETILKIDELVELRNTFNYTYLITLDGGVNMNTRGSLDKLDTLTVGSFVTMSDDFQKSLDEIR